LLKTKIQLQTKVRSHLFVTASAVDKASKKKREPLAPSERSMQTFAMGSTSGALANNKRRSTMKTKKKEPLGFSFIKQIFRPKEVEV
jgi:hypothetical protein